MSRQAPHAPTAKLGAEQLARVQREGIRAADDHDLPVGRRQVQRILANKSWAQGWRPPRVPDNEWKVCRACGRSFGRRFPSGRARSETLWAQKVTCGNACNIRLNWQLGRYRDRARPKKADERRN